MRKLRIIGHRLQSLLRRSTQEDDLAVEIEIHLKQLTRQLIAEGMSPRDAELEARRQFGPVEVTKEECRDMRRTGPLEDIFKDIAFALRLFRKSPGFTLTALVSLALGIGANTAIFQVFDAVRLRVLPVERPNELVYIRILGEGRSGNFRGGNSEMTNSIWEEIKRRQTSFSSVLAYGAVPFNLSPSGELRNVEGLWVSGSFFPALGIRPHLGRLLTPDDDRPGCGSPGAVISHAFWLREFGGDSGVLSRTLSVNGSTVPILGVTPPEFFGVEVGKRFDVAMPVCSGAAADLNNRMLWFLAIMGRLKPGTDVAAARADLAAISRGIFESTVPPYMPEMQALYTKLKLDLLPAEGGYSAFRDGFQNPLLLLFCMVAFVLLLACANLANMMLARATAREHEFAVRVSLGASRWRLIRQVLIESLLLGLAGACVGAISAPIISRTLITMLDVHLQLDSDWRVIAFAIAAGLVATVLFGLAPALRAGRVESRGTSATREKLAFRKVLLVAQVALCTILLTASLLFARSFHNLLTTDPGFKPQGLLVVSTFFNATQYPPERRAPVIEELHQRISTIPGVAGVARSYVTPISGNGWDRGARVNPTDPAQEANLTSVSAGYFRVMSIPFLAGRDFDSSDRLGTTPVAIVSQAFADTFFGGKNPVGKTFHLGGLDQDEPPYEIIGLVGNTKYSDIQENFAPIAYFADSQEKIRRTTTRYVLRTTASPETLINPVKQVIAALDPRLNMRFAVIETQISDSLRRERMMATLTSAFGALGMMLALTGIFGVTAYVVVRRYREFGIRIALGSTSRGILQLVLADLAVVMAAGIVLGIALGLITGRVASTLLYGVKPHDWITIVSVVAILGGSGLLAGLIPALRAARVAPVEALRVE